jgi:chromosome segregation ATPase
VELAAQKAAAMEAEIARLLGALAHAEDDMWQRAGAAETMQAEIAALRESLLGVEQRLRQDAEEAVRIRADTTEARQTVEEALRAAEDAACKVQGLEAEIASLESALATARQVGRAALEAMAVSHPIPMPVATPSRSRQLLRRLLGFRSHRQSERSNPPVAVSPASLGDSLPARAAR